MLNLLFLDLALSLEGTRAFQVSFFGRAFIMYTASEGEAIAGPHSRTGLEDGLGHNYGGAGAVAAPQPQVFIALPSCSSSCSASASRLV